MDYSFEQKVYAISWAVTTDNYHEAVRQYKKKYHEPFPDHKTIKRWHEKLVATGNLSCNQAGQGRRVSASGDDTENGILRIIESEPGTSQRKMASQLNTSQPTIHRTLKRANIKMWKPQRKQELKQADFQARRKFCEFVLRKSNEDKKFLENLVFSDEANFHVSGHVNLHNSFFYGQNNPNVIIPKCVNSPSVGIFAAAGSSGIVSFRTYRRTINSEFFLEILEQDVWPYFRHRRNLILQLDGAPAHFGKIVRDFLNNKFCERWIGRGGSLADYPPRSPDLTVCDFFLWGFLRDKVYSHSIHNVDQLEQIIKNEITQIPVSFFRNSLQSFRQRCEDCLNNNGGYFE